MINAPNAEIIGKAFVWFDVSIKIVTKPPTNSIKPKTKKIHCFHPIGKVKPSPPLSRSIMVFWLDMITLAKLAVFVFVPLSNKIRVTIIKHILPGLKRC